jgi:hypothetical protein
MSNPEPEPEPESPKLNRNLDQMHSRRSSPGKILSVEEVQRLALGAGGVSHRFFCVYACARPPRRLSLTPPAQGRRWLPRWLAL